ncbi:acyl carrier protein [Paenibacillus sp. SI8]|uniref:acyl carrier protein n=1 Tax=unclassified Paenibacillus TaxID=185978 RepID=UPI0034671E1D
MSIEMEQEIQNKVFIMLSGVCKLSIEDIHIDANLVDDLGLDSIRFLELMAEIEETFSFQLEVEDLHPELFQTVLSVVRFIRKRTDQL